MAPLLEVRDLAVELAGGPPLRVVDAVTLSVERSEVVGLVGESGSGKSMTAFALMNLFPTMAARIASGEVRFDGEDLRAAGPARWRQLRGARLAMIFQDPTTYLDPLMPVGDQVAETLRSHGRSEGANSRAVELLELMELPRAAAVARQYPHELSGGMRQRVLIAAALAMNPDFLIADEPTTALDVTIQAGILDLLLRLRHELGLAILLITHDLGVVAQACDRVYVMYAGRIVETNSVERLFRSPRHPYTQGLLRSTLAVEGTAAADLFSIPGRVPEPRSMPAGCRFHPRCPLALPDPCQAREPSLTRRPDGGEDACWRASEPALPGAWV